MHYRWEFVAPDAIPRGAVTVTDEARIVQAVAYFRFLGDALALDDEGFHDAVESFPPSMTADAREDMQAYFDRAAPGWSRPVLVILRGM
jgi:hypothetical protein